MFCLFTQVAALPVPQSRGESAKQLVDRTHDRMHISDGIPDSSREPIENYEKSEYVHSLLPTFHLH